MKLGGNKMKIDTREIFPNASFFVLVYKYKFIKISLIIPSNYVDPWHINERQRLE